MASGHTAIDAAAYERLMGRWSRHFAGPLIDFADLAAGDRVPDVACGTGSLALALAARPEPAAIVGVDIAAPCIAYAAAGVTDEPRLSFRVGDATALDPAADQARARHFSSPLTRPGELVATLGAAGVAEVHETSLTIRMDYADFADYWEPIADAQGPVGDYVKSLVLAAIDRLRAAVRGAYLAGAPDRPRSLAATAWAARGIVP